MYAKKTLGSPSHLSSGGVVELGRLKKLLLRGNDLALRVGLLDCLQLRCQRGFGLAANRGNDRQSALGSAGQNVGVQDIQDVLPRQGGRCCCFVQVAVEAVLPLLQLREKCLLHADQGPLRFQLLSTQRHDMPLQVFLGQLHDALAEVLQEGFDALADLRWADLRGEEPDGVAVDTLRVPHAAGGHVAELLLRPKSVEERLAHEGL
mmetsp:Transcript_75709/g.157790  ORF Transcript_75709/g.157790 Transcript_75709/m.157790 type:complete len:206 (-) Transcript_75709:223-840(-)